MLVFSRENFLSFHEDAWRIFPRHRTEVEGESAVAMDLAGYVRAEQGGQLRVFTVRSTPGLELYGL